MVAGVLGSVVTVWVTFVPCFLWIFAGAPYIEALRGSRALNGALSAITAAVVGVISNLSLWFAFHVVFGVGSDREFGWRRLLVAAGCSDNVAAVVRASLALPALFRFTLGMPKTLAASAALGLVWKLALG
jgi:chromate transporter